MNSYKSVSEFGSNNYSHVNNPLTYCLDNTIEQRFLHGSSHSDTLGQHSKSCQLFLSEYCSQKWDNFCEAASQNNSKSYPFHSQHSSLDNTCSNLTAGESLILNTASRKYLVKMLNCDKVYKPFDPTVATSPMISYWVPNCYASTCIPVYEVDPKNIDDDIVMNKILENPKIATNLLTNIFNTMKRKGNLKDLKGTKLGFLYKLYTAQTS